jgi:hypothetical protein
MSYDWVLLFTDIGLIGSISALIITVAVVLGRREDARAASATAIRTNSTSARSNFHNQPTVQVSD